MSTKATSLQDFLAHVSPFEAIPAKELERLVSLAREKEYAKGETIFSEGDPADSVWVLKEGRIQIFKYLSNGRPVAIESLGPKELFGTLCRLGNNGRNYPCTSIASTACHVIQILDRTFLEYYNRFPAMVMGVCALCSQRLNEMQGISCAGQESVEKRIARTLLQMQKTRGNTLAMTKRELAELTGTTVETAIRTMSSFTKKGLVSSVRGQIKLLDLTKIQNIVDASC